jgi:hypothetical protein
MMVVVVVVGLVVNTWSSAGAVQNWNVKWLKKKNEQNKNGLNNNEAIKREHELEVVFFPRYIFPTVAIIIIIIIIVIITRAYRSRREEI